MTNRNCGDEHDMGHIVTKSVSPETQETNPRGASERAPSQRPSDQLRADARWSTMPARQIGPPTLRCDWCHGEVDAHFAGRVIRCDCGQRLSVPTRIRVRCGRCSFSHWVRSRELQVERLCASCGQPLVIQDVVLSPLRRHRPKPFSAAGSSGSHGNAVWTMLLLGMALLAAFMLFSKL